VARNSRRPLDALGNRLGVGDRSRRVAASAIAGAASRLVVAAATFASVAVGVRAFGTDGYGVFAALTAVAALLVFSDLGLGNGLVNVIANARAQGDLAHIQKAVSTSLAMLVGVGLIGVGLAIVASFLPWARILAVPDAATGSIAPGLAVIVLVTTAIGIPLAITPGVLFALQEGYLASAILAAGTAVGAGLFVASSQFHLGLEAATLGWQLGPLTVLALAGIAVARQRSWLRPSISGVSAILAARLMRVGGLFLILQLAVAVAYESDVVVASNVLGPSQAAIYAIALQLFAVGGMLASLVNLPLWPAYADAIARKDLPWVRRTLRRAVLFALLISGIPALALLFLAPAILELWIGRPVTLEPAFLVGVAGWTVIYATFNSISIFLNAANVVRFQVVIASTMATASVVLSYTLAHAFGLTGIIWGTLVAYIAFAGIPIALYLPRLTRRLLTESEP